jgi:predicted SprT family Zn-dependent metalloprotease
VAVTEQARTTKREDTDMHEDDGYDGIQYDTFNGPRASYRCVLCGETYPRPERLNSRNECADCVGAS